MKTTIKRLFFTWAIIYPLITILLFFIDALDLGLPLPMQTFALTILVVPTMMLLIAPAIARIIK